MDSCNEIIKILEDKIKQENYDPEPEVEEKEKKKPKKTDKQLFFLPSNINVKKNRKDY